MEREMSKVVINKVVNVSVMIEKMKSEIEYLNNGFEYSDIVEIIKEGGDGVYEFVFGCRGGLEEFRKSDEYMGFEEWRDNIKSVYGEDFDDEDCDWNEWYDDGFMLWESGNEEWMYCVSYGEEEYSVFVNVKND
jgi:hypothetical protein